MTVWAKLKRERHKQTEGRCEGCRRKVAYTDCVGHHITYRSRGGQNTADNLRLYCRDCEALVHGVKGGLR